MEYWATKRRWVVDAPKKVRISYQIVNGQRTKVFWYNGAWRDYDQFYSQYVQYTHLAYRNLNGRKIKYMYYRGNWVPYDKADWTEYIMSITTPPEKTKISYEKVLNITDCFAPGRP